MSADRLNAFQRLFRGETSFDFAGRWKRWFAISGLIILVGLVSLGVRGVNFSIDFKGGTEWIVPTSASVSEAKAAVSSVDPSLASSATVQVLTTRLTGQRQIEVSGAAKTTGNDTTVVDVTTALAKMAHVSSADVTINAIGPSWGSDITSKAIRAVIIFLIACAGYIWLRFEGKMAVAALVALLHDILVTVGIYSLSGFQVSPDTVIAFLTILGYSLYDTIVVFDKVQENTRGLASTGRFTYTDTVNLSMNTVLARSLNTSFVAILPILSILVIGAGVLGATSLNDFGLALLIGLTTGAYSSIFIASPLLALLKEREPRYAQIRQRLASRPGTTRRLTPLAAATGAFGAEGAPAAPIRRTSTRTRSTRPGGAGTAIAPPAGAAIGADSGIPAGPAPGGSHAAGPGVPGNGAPPVSGAGNGSLSGNGTPAGTTGADDPVDPTAAGAGGPRPTNGNGDVPSGPVLPARAGNRPPPRPRKKRRR